jgi:hypothetical protein
MPTSRQPRRRAQTGAERQQAYRERQRQREAVSASPTIELSSLARGFLEAAVAWAARQESATAQSIGLTAAAELEALPDDNAKEERLTRVARLLDLPQARPESDAVGRVAIALLVEAQTRMTAGTARISDVRSGIRGAKTLVGRRQRVDAHDIEVAMGRLLAGEPPPPELVHDEDIEEDDE